MARYDRRVLTECADQVLSQADRSVATYALLGLLLGAVFGAGGTAYTGSGLALGIGAVIGLGLGMVHGGTIALALRMQAQLALCQVEIEEHTKRSAAAAPIPERATPRFGAPRQ